MTQKHTVELIRKPSGFVVAVINDFSLKIQVRDSICLKQQRTVRSDLENTRTFFSVFLICRPLPIRQDLGSEGLNLHPITNLKFMFYCIRVMTLKNATHKKRQCRLKS